MNYKVRTILTLFLLFAPSRTVETLSVARTVWTYFALTLILTLVNLTTKAKRNSEFYYEIQAFGRQTRSIGLITQAEHP